MIQDFYLFIQQHNDDPIFIILVVVVILLLMFFLIRNENKKIKALLQEWGRTRGLTLDSFVSSGYEINGKEYSYWSQFVVSPFCAVFLDESHQKRVVYMMVNTIPFVPYSIKEVELDTRSYSDIEKEWEENV